MYTTLKTDRLDRPAADRCIGIIEISSVLHRTGQLLRLYERNAFSASEFLSEMSLFSQTEILNKEKYVD